MKTDYTHIALVLDRSGSMAQIRTDTIGGVNTFLKTQQETPGECTFTLVQFDSTAIEMIVDAKPVKSIEPLTEATFVPRHNTPLYDAVGFTIDATGTFLAGLSELARPSKVIFVIVTDGLENASVTYNAPRVRQMVKHQTEVYKWEFVFLGVGIDSYAVGGAMGVAAGLTMNLVGNSGSIRRGFKASAENIQDVRTRRGASMEFKKIQRDEQREAGAKE